MSLQNEKHSDYHRRYSANCARNTKIEINRLILENGVNLNCVTFSPATKNENLPIVFIAGFASVIENFTDLFTSLTQTYIVHYVETRDKTSSIIPGDAGFPG